MDIKTYTLLQITVFLAFLLGVKALDNQKLELDNNKIVALRRLEVTTVVERLESCWGSNCYITTTPQKSAK